jgi:hypothetical protein
MNKKIIRIAATTGGLSLGALMLLTPVPQLTSSHGLGTHNFGNGLPHQTSGNGSTQQIGGTGGPGSTGGTGGPGSTGGTGSTTPPSPPSTNPMNPMPPMNSNPMPKGVYVTGASIPSNVPSGGQFEIKIKFENTTGTTQTGSMWYEYPSNVTGVNVLEPASGCTVYPVDHTVYCADLSIPANGTSYVEVSETAPTVTSPTQLKGHVYFQDSDSSVKVYGDCQNISTTVSPIVTTPLADPFVLAGIAVIGSAGAVVIRRRRRQPVEA